MGAGAFFPVMIPAGHADAFSLALKGRPQHLPEEEFFSVTRRRWIAENWDEASATLVGAQADHLARVLRAQPGMTADVVAGGRVFRAEVASVSLAGEASFSGASPSESSEVHFTLLAELEAGPALPITLALAIYKFDRMEWAIEKVTELGVAAIAPVIAQRTEKHLAQAAARRAERWRRIAREAAQQARRSDVPLVHDPVPLAERVRAESRSASKPASGTTRLVLAEQERTTTLRHALEEALAHEERTSSGARMPSLELAIGPEGGWAPSEEALFDANGWRAVSLGPRILRAETAAITALAVVASYLE
jgi:16S rRNA (uracil1498-N3)-methyltransferase